MEVSCPEIIVGNSKGERFTCTATSAGRPSRIDARITDTRRGAFTSRLSTIDAAANEVLIRADVSRTTGARVASVTCPEGLRNEQGATFSCLVTAKDGSKGKVRGYVTNDEGAIRFRVPFLQVRPIAAAMSDALAKQLKAPVKIACREIIVVQKKIGETVTCKGTLRGETRDVSARLLDAEGNLSIRVK